MNSEYGWQLTREHVCRKPYLWFAKAGQQWRCPCKLPTGDRCGKPWEVIVDPDHGDPKKLAWREVVESTPDGRLERFVRVDDPELDYWLEEELRDMGRPTPPRDVVAAIRKHFVIGKVQ
jgi:hypothetical protein